MTKRKTLLHEMDRITQRELSAILKARIKVEELSNALTDLRAKLYDLETALMVKLTDKQPIEAGKLTAGLDTKFGPCRPPWREIHLNHMAASHPAMPISEVERLVRLDFKPVAKMVLVILPSRDAPAWKQQKN